MGATRNRNSVEPNKAATIDARDLVTTKAGCWVLVLDAGWLSFRAAARNLVCDSRGQTGYENGKQDPSLPLGMTRVGRSG